MTLTVGSLFAGIGGLELGLERAGMTVKWQVEIDEYCRQVLAKHWPDVPRWDDVCTFPPEDWTAEQLEVDLICGGWPCQDISTAGKGAGLEGARSGLFYEVIRLAGILRPRYLLLENVSALLARGLGTVLGELAQVGYDAQWHCIPAASVGAPHRRDRVFILADTNNARQDKREKPTGRAEFRGCRQDVADTDNQRKSQPQGGQQDKRGRPSNSGENVPDTDSAGRKEQRWTKPAQTEFSTPECSSWWSVEPQVGRVADGIPRRVDRLRGLGNAVVPQVAEFIGKAIMEGAEHEDIPNH